MTEIQQTPVSFLKAFKELFDESYRYIVYYGGRSSGKSQQTALALLLRARKKKLRIVCTREVQNTIKDSVHKLLVDLINKYEFVDYEVTGDTIVNTVTGSEFIFKGLRLNINEIKSMANIDIAWVEEAQSITEKSLNILTPTIRNPGSQIIFTFNRYTDLDPVFVRFVLKKPPGTFVKHINYDVLDKLGLLPDVIKMEIEEDKNTPEVYAHKWLGEPISQDVFSIVPREAVLGAMNRTIAEPEGSIEVGVDVARMGNDRIVFWMVHGLKTLRYEVFNKKRTTEVCDLLERFCYGDRTIVIKVDDTGVGGGVTDEMIKRGYNVIAINFGGEPQDKDKYPNLISEAWFSLLNILEKADLPMDKDLLMELSTRKWKQDIKGRRVVESKQEYKKRGYRSPDLADGCIIAYYRGALNNMIRGDDYFFA